ncbi:MAG TPA: hypothetical protein VKP30_20620, partial [Polyangiaceae bacterium]|nr:hypothetical protein [Polyangiaceae bacterium]
DCLVDGYEPLVEGLELPDPNDRHVLAAAIHGGASVIVTMNLRDFPERFLVPHAVEVRATAKTVRTWVVGTLPTGAPAHLARQFAGWVCDIDGGLGGS